MTRSTGIAGIMAGVALAVEFGLFMLSGFTPETFAHPDSAMGFLRERGGYLRAAVLVGAAGAALTTVFVVGVAARLRDATPTRAATSLYLGVVGGGGHGLVALTFWIGIPTLVSLSASDPDAAAAAVSSLILLTGGAEAFGNLFLALSMAAAGSAILASGALPGWIGWVALAAAAFTVARIVAIDTPLAALAFAAFFPSLILAVVFRIAAGIALGRSEADQPGRQPERVVGTASR